MPDIITMTSSPSDHAAKSRGSRVSFVRQRNWAFATVGFVVTLAVFLWVEFAFGRPMRALDRIPLLTVGIHVILVSNVLLGVVRTWSGGLCTIDSEAGIIDDNGGIVYFAHIATPRVFDEVLFDDRGRKVRRRGIAVNTRQTILGDVGASLRRLQKIADTLQVMVDEYWERRRAAAGPDDEAFAAATANRSAEIEAMRASSNGSGETPAPLGW